MSSDRKNNNQERCHRCRCAAHCDDRLCGDCKECTECACWPCQHRKNPTIYDADLLS